MYLKHCFYLTFLSIVFSSPFTYSQNKQKDSYTVYLNSPGGSVRATVVFENRNVRARENLTYSWYTSNKIVETKGGYDGRLLDGSYTAFYFSDNLKEQGVYHNGVKNSEWRSWYENGKIKEIVNWKHGIKDGINKKFDTRGNLASESRFRNGKIHGYEILFDDQKIISKKKYKHGIEIVKTDKKKISIDTSSVPKHYRYKDGLKDKNLGNGEKANPSKKRGSEGEHIEKPLTSAEKHSEPGLTNRIRRFFNKKEHSKSIAIKNENNKK